MTFGQLCELEPGLQDLHTIARMIQDNGSGEAFCANLVWHNLFKPRIYDLVGWGRVEIVKRNWKSGKELEKLGVTVLGQKEEWSYEKGLLDSSEAYDVAYHAIYDQLPNCRDCWCL